MTKHVRLESASGARASSSSKNASLMRLPATGYWPQASVGLRDELRVGRIVRKNCAGGSRDVEFVRDSVSDASGHTCPSRIRCQAATGSWTGSWQWETQHTLFSSARATVCPPAKVNGVWPSNDAWLRAVL